jgi:oxygen-dependent protoporphyrinogen oxidase
MRVVVIGGGVTGLAAAHRLGELAAERGLTLDLRLLEASDRLGGVIRTVHREGCVLEHGPDSMITDKPWGLALAKRLGLEAEIIGTQAQHRRSFVVHGGRLHPVPEGFQLLAPSRFGPLVSTPLFSWPGKARMALDLLLPARQEDADESLGAFVTRRLGREALERIAQPMIGGIYGADPMQTSLLATLPRFRDMERQHGSVIRGMWARSRETARKAAANGKGPEKGGVSGARYGLFVTFRRGMQTLTDALVAHLPADSARLNTRVTGLERQREGWRVLLADGELLDADAVLLTLPAPACTPLLAPHDAELARLLAEVPYAGAATLTLGYRREQVPHPLDGFGFVVPSVEGFSILGCTFTHMKFAERAPEGVALLRAFLGGAAIQGRELPELAKLVRTDLHRLLGIPTETEPLFVEGWRCEGVMPHYRVGHLERVAEMERRAAALSGLELAGNAYRGVGIPDSIHSAEQAAERLMERS